MRLSFRERGGATGNLEICINDTWLPVCFGTPALSDLLPVACRALGFTAVQGTRTERPLEIPSFVQPTFGDGLICSGAEQSLADCDLLELEGDRSCIIENVVRITCPGEWDVI